MGRTFGLFVAVMTMRSLRAACVFTTGVADPSLDAGLPGSLHCVCELARRAVQLLGLIGTELIDAFVDEYNKPMRTMLLASPSSALQDNTEVAHFFFVRCNASQYISFTSVDLVRPSLRGDRVVDTWLGPHVLQSSQPGQHLGFD